MALVDASPEGWKEHGRFKLDPQTTQRSKSGKIWTHPVVSGGRLYLRDQELLTTPVALLRLDGEYVKEYGKLMAGYAISSIPLIVLFLFTMRMFVRGLTAGAVKG